MSMNWMGVSIASTNRGSKCETRRITLMSHREDIRLGLHLYDLQPLLKVLKHLIYMLVPKRAQGQSVHSCLGQLLGVRIRVKSLLPRAHNRCPVPAQARCAYRY